MVDSRWSLVFRAPTCDNDRRLSTNDLLLRPLKVDEHDGLEGLSLAVPDIGPIAPLLHGVDGGGGQSRVSLDQSHALNLAVLIHDLLEDNRSFRRPGARFDRIFRRHAVGQPALGTLGRENDSAALPRQLGAGRSRSRGVFFAVAGLGFTGCC